MTVFNPTESAPLPSGAIHDDSIRRAILDQLGSVDTGKTIGPTDIARSLMGNDEKQWRTLMKPIRRVAVSLAQNGEASIYRKGKIIDPAAIRGVFRIGHPAQPERTRDSEQNQSKGTA